MKAFASATVIQATPQAVWSVLTDGAQWTTWNPTVDKVEGTIASGVAFSMSMREVFTGWMAPLIAASIPDMQPAFDAFAAALKRRCEQKT